jgi:4a-hydroxytetrahydrobiopterin dehydratase
MSSRTKLDDPALDALRHTLPEWSLSPARGALTKTFELGDFSRAWAFMSRAALWAERAQHHPEWFNVYGRVEVTLTTHDAGGVTSLDVAFARAMDGYAAELAPPAPRTTDAP